MKKTKTASKTKPRSKAAKIAALKRSAAGKAVHHKRKLRKNAVRHLYVFALLLLVTLVTSGVVASMADNLVPPPGQQIDLEAYIRDAEAHRAATMKPPDQTGIASWYAIGLRAPDAHTCASTRFPRGTYLKVRDLRNGREVVCLVNDYGPQKGTRRVIDLSRGSYRMLEGLGSGTMPVEIRVVPGPQ